jgi:septin family protein
MQDFFLSHELAPCPPFSIINPNCVEYINGGKVLRLVRENLGCTLDVLDKKVTDFTRLHNLVLKYIRKELVLTI